MSSQSKARRMPGLDASKALAIFLVVLYHVLYPYMPDMIDAPDVWDYLRYFFETLLGCCVPLFFTVSGALALRKPVELRKNTRRCIHLLLLTVVWVLIALLVVLALRRENPGVKEFIKMCIDLRYPYIQYLWYLPCFLFLCLMTPVLSALKEHAPKVYGYFILLIFVMTFGNRLLNDLEYLLRWCLGKLDGHSGDRAYFWKLNFFTGNYWYSFCYYALGDYLMNHGRRLLRHKGILALSIPLSMCALFVLSLARSYVGNFTMDHVFNQYSSVFVLIITAAVFLLLRDAAPGPKPGRGVTSLAQCSLGVYTLHWLVLEAFRCFFPALMETWPLFIPEALVILLLSWGLTLLFRCVPVLRRLFSASVTR